MEPVKWNDAGAALLSYCCCGGEPMTDQEYGEFVRLPLVIALSQRPVTKNEFKTNRQICQEGIRPDNIALRKATFRSMLSYLEFKKIKFMEIETARKTSELYKQLEDLKHKSYVEAVYLAKAQQEVRDHQANFEQTESEIKKIAQEIADLN